MGDVLLKTEGITKEFSGVRVLNNISIEVMQGEIFGLIGENGAGKSTLIKILNGTYTPTQGRVLFEGRPVEIKDTGVAKAIGINTIPQEFNLISHLDVYENIFLGREYRKGLLLDRRAMIRKTQELMQQLDTDIEPDAKIEDLSVAQKQMVEIAKAIAYDSKLLIMDEPTTVLTHNEIAVLFRLMERLRAGGVTVIYISHKLSEVRHICDRVMVLRDGQFVSLDKTNAIDEQEMAKRMVGRELSQIFPGKSTPSQELALQVQDLSVPGVLDNINFELRKGEVLGFAGLVGAGRTELAETLLGVRRPSSGLIKVSGREREIRSPIDAIQCKLAYLSEDRQGTGILTGFDITSNVTLSSLAKYAKLLVNKAAERKSAQHYVDAFNIKAPSLREKLEYLSGGNQQKVSLAKCLDINPEVLIIDEPTRGIDVNAKREIYHFIQELVASGIACMLISSDMEEILGLCNRVVVMRSGKITGTLTEEQMSEEEIMFHATGLKEGAA